MNFQVCSWCRGQDVILQSSLWCRIQTGNIFLWSFFGRGTRRVQVPAAAETHKLAAFVDKCNGPSKSPSSQSYSSSNSICGSGKMEKMLPLLQDRAPSPAPFPAWIFKSLISHYHVSQWTQTRWLRPGEGMLDWVTGYELNNPKQPFKKTTEKKPKNLNPKCFPNF